ncbi:expressed unknown protein [Seminavis robusta]|uniref:Uncharacterized protein n=1 Tax=Seminavis robusta TaxID=568900 RepID=A0A9N8H0I9_9STRA|nr:expressed unknown protein [Seminavis robusta]|eukprot:Sro3_g002010.1 n/a (216) ;mRNA; r:21741-22506
MRMTKESSRLSNDPKKSWKEKTLGLRLQRLSTSGSKRRKMPCKRPHGPRFKLKIQAETEKQEYTGCLVESLKLRTFKLENDIEAIGAGLDVEDGLDGCGELVFLVMLLEKLNSLIADPALLELESPIPPTLSALVENLANAVAKETAAIQVKERLERQLEVGDTIALLERHILECEGELGKHHKKRKVNYLYHLLVHQFNWSLYIPLLFNCLHDE